MWFIKKHHEFPTLKIYTHLGDQKKKEEVNTMCKKFVEISKDSKRYSQTGRNHSRDQRKFKAFKKRARIPPGKGGGL